MIPTKDNKKSIPLFKPSLYTLLPLLIRSICKSDDVFSQLFIVLRQAVDEFHHCLHGVTFDVSYKDFLINCFIIFFPLSNNSSSYSFSPGRIPVSMISISSSLYPLNRIMFWLDLRFFTGSLISKIKDFAAFLLMHQIE